MKFLLDTHVILWAAARPERIPPATRQVLTEPTTRLYFSAASVWEISIKLRLNRADFRVDLRKLVAELIRQGYEEIPIRSHHALPVEHLPLLHGDPFDRLLIAQAIVENLTLLTGDATVASYPGPIQLI